MSLECGECERDLRGPHAPGCSYAKTLTMTEAVIAAGPRPRERRGYTLFVRRHHNRFGDTAIWVYRRRAPASSKEGGHE